LGSKLKINRALCPLFSAFIASQNEEEAKMSELTLAEVIEGLEKLRRDYQTVLRLRDRVERLEKIALQRVHKPNRKQLATRAKRSMHRRAKWAIHLLRCGPEAPPSQRC